MVMLSVVMLNVMLSVVSVEEVSNVNKCASLLQDVINYSAKKFVK
jgi:hypothetical protein